jgi:hypothetical protein
MSKYVLILKVWTIRQNRFDDIAVAIYDNRRGYLDRSNSIMIDRIQSQCSKKGTSQAQSLHPLHPNGFATQPIAGFREGKAGRVDS